MLTDQTWKHLGGSRKPGSSGTVAIRLHPESKLNVFAALDQITGTRFLLLQSVSNDIIMSEPLPCGRGFFLKFLVSKTVGEKNKSCLQFELTDLAYADVFNIICNDVLRNVVQSEDETRAFQNFAGKIVEWQTFLDQIPQDGLSESAQLGLFAELWFLNEVLLEEIGPEKAVRSWKGPKALAKDFQFAGISVEVKASSSKQHTYFNIPSEIQLDDHHAGRLILFCLLLERVEAEGKALPELVMEIRLKLQTCVPALTEFSELLLQTGYVDAHAEYYQTKYAKRFCHFFDVRDNFPRIVESDLRLGVGDVRYSILLSECKHYEIEKDKVLTVIKKTG